ncbi:hypothetical protein [Aliarcobacter butzleri]|uniref:hypothetical protein n=1 Tax=Aliarcobacter butzleri TaxID=28197 RepID=UPI001269BEC4|nr:hypothetical protein [Aliarcobacter butzleri]
MNASDLLNAIIDKINEEIEQLLEVQDNDQIAGNEISEPLSITNYKTISLEYINAVDKLLCNQVQIKFFLKYIITTIQKIDSIYDDFEVSENFKYCEINKDIIKHLYIENENIKNEFFYENKVIIISTVSSNFDSFLNSLETDLNYTKKLILIAKALLDNLNYQKNINKDRIIFLSNCSDDSISNFNTNQNELVSYLKLCILFEGKSFHKHFNFNSSLSTRTLACDHTKEYTEFKEIFFILSEYNKSNDLLNKYFLLYTVIENFMYRCPIAKMINITNEFNIRDFQFFYNQIATKEIVKIEELFKNIKNVSYNTTVPTLFDLIKNEINTFKTSNFIIFSDLNELFRKINVRKSTINLNDIKLEEFISNNIHNIIYMLRNTILHNTETEFHLTHFELSKYPFISEFIQKLMIPLLEKIILHLILTNDPLIKYTQSELILYKKLNS